MTLLRRLPFAAVLLGSALPMMPAAPARAQQPAEPESTPPATTRPARPAGSASEDAFERWNRERLSGYEKLRVTGADVDRSVEGIYRFRDDDIPAGRYAIELPGGVPYRVEVFHGREAPKDGWTRSEYDHIESLVRELSGLLRDIHFHLHHQGKLEGVQPVIKVTRQTLGMLSESIRRRAPIDDIQRQHKAFEEEWQRLFEALEGADVRSTRLRTLMSQSEEVARGVDLVLSVAPAPLYDRLRVAALAQRLVESVRRLPDAILLDDEPDWLVSRVRGNVNEVQRAAESFAALVEQNAPFQEVVAQYGEFDEAWNRLQKRVTPADADAPFAKIERDVTQVSRSIHRLLKIETPFASGRQRLEATVRELDQDVSAYARTLRDGDAEWDELRVELELLASAVHNLQQSIRDRASEDMVRTDYESVRLEWKRLQDMLRDRPAPETTRDLSTRIETGLENLGESIP